MAILPPFASFRCDITRLSKAEEQLRYARRYFANYAIYVSLREMLCKSANS